MALVTQSGMVGNLRLEITRFGCNARVIIPREYDDNRLGCDLIAWELESDEAVSLVLNVLWGRCLPAILADFMDEHPYRQSLISQPKACRMLREFTYANLGTV